MSPIPVSENFPITSQPKVRSAGHWAALSRDLVVQTKLRLKEAGASEQTGLYVALPANPTDFDRAFRDFLITELVKSGQRVMDNDKAPLVLTYNTQIVKHNSYRPHHIPAGYTALAAGLYVLREASEIVAAALTVAAADAMSSEYSGGPTSTELLLTTTVTGAGRYMARSTDVYYVEESDTSLFSVLAAPVPTYGVKSMKVVGQ